jgi:hypothetical protein
MHRIDRIECPGCADANAARSRATGERFLAKLAELGATLLEPGYLGGETPHHIRCAQGHDCYPKPSNVLFRGGICKICAGQDSATAEAAFKATLEKSGATFIGPYINARTPCHVRCSKGHDAYPWPGSVQSGGGICAECAGKTWDAFYVVTGTASLKFGITSGDPRTRLGDHRRDGYIETVRLFINLPEGVARALENKVLKALKGNSFMPVQRREYFSIEALPLVLGIVDEVLAAWCCLLQEASMPEGIAG